jgi:hypothetical protein
VRDWLAQPNVELLKPHERLPACARHRVCIQGGKFALDSYG